MSFQGTYSPASWVLGDWSTYPVPADATDPFDALYQPGYWWEFDSAGSIDGTPVVAGDRFYVLGRARQFGDATFGRGVFGQVAGANWLVEVTRWVVQTIQLSPWLADPAPSDGCPLGDRHPDWLVIVDRLEWDGGATFQWHDLSDRVALCTIRRGTWHGDYSQQPDELLIDLVDPDGDITMNPKRTGSLLNVGDRLRAGLRDPDGTYWPLCTARVESISDRHDQPPRVLQVAAYGHTMDLVAALAQYQAPEQPAAARLEALADAAGWTWAPYEYDETPGVDLLADEDPADADARSRSTLAALSSGWTMDTDPCGVMRVRVWPLPTGTPAHHVTDCPDPTEQRLESGRIVFGDDLAELLTVAVATNRDSQESTKEDAAGVAAWGRYDSSHGLPALGLETRYVADLRTLTDRWLARWRRTVRRARSVELDSLRDPAWLAAACQTDTGMTIDVSRERVDPFTVRAVVVGVELTVTPGRLTGTWHLAGITTTVLPAGADTPDP